MRVTTALSNAVAVPAWELSWKGTAREYGLNWKSVAAMVKRAVAYGLKHRARPPVHVIGIDEVSRRKGQVYLTVVYDLERRVLLGVGGDRTEEALRPFFTQEMGIRRCQTLRVVCMDMWVPYAKLVRDHAVNAQILFDRFHIVKHLHEAVEAARRNLWRQPTSMERVTRSKPEPFKKFVGMLRSHLDRVLAWTKTRLSNGAVEGMNNKIKSINHQSFGFRSAANVIAAIYHCCARLPLFV